MSFGGGKNLMGCLFSNFLSNVITISSRDREALRVEWSGFSVSRFPDGFANICVLKVVTYWNIWPIKLYKTLWYECNLSMDTMVTVA